MTLRGESIWTEALGFKTRFSIPASDSLKGQHPHRDFHDDVQFKIEALHILLINIGVSYRLEIILALFCLSLNVGPTFDILFRHL